MYGNKKKKPKNFSLFYFEKPIWNYIIFKLIGFNQTTCCNEKHQAKTEREENDEK